MRKIRAPKVLVFTPIYEAKDYCFEEFLTEAKKLTYPNFHHIIIDNSKDDTFFKTRVQPLCKRFDVECFYVGRGANSREGIARAQNHARLIAIKENYDYMFTFESDIFAPHNIIEHLLSWNLDVISGLYFIGDSSKGERVPCIAIPQYHEEIGMYGSRLLDVEEWFDYLNKGLKLVHTAGFGCCLISRRAFINTPFRYDERFAGHSDIWFFHDMQKKKISVWVDTDMICDHQNSRWADVKDR